MIFKNISKLLLLIPFFILSCKSLDLISKKEEKIINYNDIIETSAIIQLNSYLTNDSVSKDSYDQLKIHKWNNNHYKKIKTFNSFGKSYIESNPILKIIVNNELLFLNHKKELIFYDLNKYKIVKKVNLELSIKDKDIYPTSLANISDNYIMSLSNGSIFSFKLDGSIIWQRDFNDILKTPIKIFDDNLIILLSNKIISLNYLNGNTNWEFLSNNNNSIKVLGGDIAILNHYIFFLLPNNNFGMIDTIMGDLVNTNYQNLFKNNPVTSSSNLISSFNNILSYYDQNTYLTSIDVSNDNILLNREKIKNVKSSVYFNNSLITLNNDNTLKAYNIVNKNLFWEVDISEKIKKNTKIVNISNYNNSIIIFFNNGLILEVNSKNGNIISDNNLKINDIIAIQNANEYLLVDQINGKTSIISK